MTPSQPSNSGQGRAGATTAADLKAGLKHALDAGKAKITGRETSPNENRRPPGSAGSGLDPVAVGSPHAINTRSNPASGLASPSLHSPTSSLIFERNVQEPVSPHDPTPAIPAHIKNEDRIPPALEASSLAITNARLNPDEVEIVTHAAHQPAAATMSENMLSEPRSPASFSRRQSTAPSEGAAASAECVDEAGLNYGSLNPNDVRRLSFISFADVVQGEHVETGAQNAAGHSTTSPGVQTPASGKPSLSPIQPGAPWSSDGGSQNSIFDRAASPGSQQPHQHGELAIETMRQALRKTTSKDLTGMASPVKTQSMSPTRGARSP